MPLPRSPSPDLHALLGAHSLEFREHFPGAPRSRCFFSPGRVNLMGAHLDYNGGPVMPTAIDRGTFIAASPRTDRRVRLASLREEAALELDLGALPTRRMGAWSDYPLGVLREVLELVRGRGLQGQVGGLELLLGGNLAIGAGLSSSASMCVGTATVLDAMWGLGLERMELVHAALRAERGFVGVHCGIMDPYAVGLARPGHLLWLDCKDASHEHLPFDGGTLTLAVADTGVRRELAASEFNRRVAECAAAFAALSDGAPGATCLRDVPYRVLEARRAELEPLLALRAEHVLCEVGRTFAARAALLAGDPARLGTLMFEAHASLRDLYQVSCPELDRLVEDAHGVPGVLGARLTGAGFGGCAVILLARGAEEELCARLEAGFRAAFGREPRVEFFVGDEGPRELSLE